MDSYQKEVIKLQERLSKIDKLERAQRKKLQTLLEQCPHIYEKNIRFKETLAFDYTPSSFCSVCGKEAGAITKEQVLSLYKEHLIDINSYDDFSPNVTDDDVLKFYEINPRGFNI